MRRVRSWLSSLDVLTLVVGVIIGLLLPHLLYLVQVETDDFLQNLVPEAVGITFTVLILDRLNARRAERQQVEQLVRRAKSRNNSVACAAIEELRVMGKLQDGTLRKRDFRGANWRDANLYKADLSGCDLENVDLRGADLIYATLTGAKVSDEQLRYAAKLRYAHMPDGTRYDGRYNLKGDLLLAQRERITLDSPEEVATFYKVPMQTYTDGQSWAKAHLAPSQASLHGYDDKDDAESGSRYDASQYPN